MSLYPAAMFGFIATSNDLDASEFESDFKTSIRQVLQSKEEWVDFKFSDIGINDGEYGLFFGIEFSAVPIYQGECFDNDELVRPFENKDGQPIESTHGETLMAAFQEIQLRIPELTHWNWPLHPKRLFRVTS